MTKTKETILILFIVILILVTLMEATLLLSLIFFADEIHCNWILCEFTKKIHSDSNISIGFDSGNCYVNNEEVNCSELNKYIWREEWEGNG